MKEKITIMMTLLSMIGLAFHYNYKTNIMVQENSNKLIKSNDVNPSNDISIELEKENNDIGYNELAIQSKCNKTIDETNKMSFNKAFNFYYSCLGKGGVFSWNNQDFLLTIKEQHETKLTNSDNKELNQILVSK